MLFISGSGGGGSMSELATAIDDQTLELSEKLDAIASNINNLVLNSGEGLQFTPITLQPTFSDNATYNWAVAPANLNNIFDGDENSGTNTFRANSSQYSDCYLKINSGIVIPEYSRIKIKMGVSNFNNNKSYFEWSVGSGLGEELVFWAEFKQRSSSETIVLIDRIIPFSWEWMKLTMIEMVTWWPLTKIYDIKVWSVN